LNKKTKTKASSISWRVYFSLIGVFWGGFSVVSIYLLSTSFFLFCIYVGSFFLLNIAQSYCCMFIECPYLGSLCPATYGIIPASFIGKLIQKRVPLSKKIFAVLTIIVILAIATMAFFPLYWLGKRSALLTIGYIFFFFSYTLLHINLICPFCMAKEKCLVRFIIKHLCFKRQLHICL